jgi:hypothetical protein
MADRVLCLDPRPFQGKPARDRIGTPRGWDRVFTGAGPNPSLARPSERMPRASGTLSGLPGGEGAHSEHRVCNLHRSGHGDQERLNLSLEGPGPKAFGSKVHDTCFPKRFRTPNNIIKYDGKTNPNVLLEDYCLACRAGGVDNDLFIIQFLPHLFSRHDQGLARSLAQKLDRLLGGSQENLHRQLSRHIRAAGNP